MLIGAVGRAICRLLVFACWAPAVSAAERAALVIGNSDYAAVERLSNPANDAAALAGALEGAGFDDVTLALDLDYAGMRRTLADFSRRSAGAEVALVYFAGHGIEIGGTNYLIPTDATLAHVEDVEFEAMPLDTVMSAFSRAGGLRLLILDACRNNPFARAMERTGASRSIGRGLARVDPPGGSTLIAYAAREGTVAADGEGEHSPFAAALMRHIATPSVDVRLMFGRVRDEVLAATGGQQEPFTYGSLGGGQLYLARSPSGGGSAGAGEGEGEAGAGTPVPAAPVSEAALAWDAVKETTNTKLLQAFVRRFSDSFYADLAMARIEELGETEVAVGVFPETAGPAGQRDLRPGDEFQDCDICPVMKVIPPGGFMMGSPDHEKERDKAEGPQHEVTIARALGVGKFEVTFGEFAAFVRESGHETGDSCATWENGITQARTGRSFDNPGFQPGDRDPVVCVGWQDIEAYVDWLAKRTGQPYRLLSEAEWEYSARGGMTHAYSFGNDVSKICRYANAADASSVESWKLTSCSDGSGPAVTPVGTYLPNPFGLHDMHGNVWEYVADCWTQDYKGAPTDGSAVTVPGCNLRIKRSGGWANPVRALRSAYRQLDGDDPVFDKGFRVGRDLADGELRASR
jgi:formylglycine-generating enzyme required for sulfatase activity